MAVAHAEGVRRSRSTSRPATKTSSSDALAVLTASMQPSAPSLPPMPAVDIPPPPPPPPPVRVPNALEALSGALSKLSFVPSPALLQIFTEIAQIATSNALEAQRLASEQALNLYNASLNRARLELDRAQAERQRFGQFLEAEQLRQEQENERRQLALGTILSIINDPSLNEPAVRAQLETIFAVYPELRSVVPQSQIEALLRARFGEEPQTSGYSGPTLGQRFGSFLDRLVPFSERYLMPSLR